MKIVFMGTPDFAVPVLADIIAAGHDVVCVYTQPPRAAGRGQTARKTPVHLAADRHGIDVRAPTSLKSEADQAAFAALEADAAVVVAYGLILPAPVLAAPRQGCFNLHASLLPRWRGAAPIQRAIMAGDEQSGVCVMRMETGLDTGPVCLSAAVPIDDATTAGVLHDTLAATGAPLMAKALGLLEAGQLSCTPQSGDAVTYAAKIEKAEAKIDFAKPANEVLRHIHGLSPFPGAWFEVVGSRIKLLRVEQIEATGVPGNVLDDRLTIACAGGAIRPVMLQKSGKHQMSLDEFLRGQSIPAGINL